MRHIGPVAPASDDQLPDPVVKAIELLQANPYCPDLHPPTRDQEVACEILYEAWLTLLAGRIRSRSISDDDVGDALNKPFFRVVSVRIPEVPRKRPDFDRFMMKVARDAFIDLGRAQRTTRARDTVYPDTLPELASPANTDDALLAEELLQKLSAGLARHDLTLLLMKIDGYSIVEIAETLGISCGALNTRWSRLKDRLIEKVAS